MNDMYRELKRKDTLIVVGNSMSPTLKALDTVYVTPCGSGEINPGDVIVFPSPKNDHKVIHRVIKIIPAGIATRGDNRRFIDEWLIKPDDVIGKVMYAQRGDRQRSIYGGSTGRLIGRLYYYIHTFVYIIKRLVYPIYSISYRSGIFRSCLPESIKPKVLSFNRPDGIELQVVMGKKIIGTCAPRSNGWLIRTPYRLFVDDAYLAEVLAARETLSMTEVDDHVKG